MEFSCSVCKYTSDKKSNITRHVNKKISCGTGTREIIEIPIEITCEFCGKNYSTKEHLREHIRKTCKYKELALQKKVADLENQLKEARKTVTINNTNTNYIIVVNNYDDTCLEKLTDKTYTKILKDNDAHQIIPNLIKQIHFDPNTPKNRNIYLSNRGKNNKHLQIYRNGQWEVTDKSTEIDNIINDKDTLLGDWISEKGQKYPDAMEKFNEYIEQKYDDDTAKLVKEEVELLLYNGRNMVNKQSG